MERPDHDAADGLFIVIEAIDLAGKTTQLNVLRDALTEAGKAVAVTSYPDRAAPITGRLIDDVLHGRVKPVLPDGLTEREAAVRTSLLTQELFSLNRRECASRLEDLIGDHDVVISSRYQLSGRVYAEGAGVPVRQIVALQEALESDLRKPDLTLVIDVDPQALAGRPREGGLDAFERDADLQRGAREAYQRYADADPRIVLVDGSGSPDAVRANLIAAVRAALPDLFDR